MSPCWHRYRGTEGAYAPEGHGMGINADVLGNADLGRGTPDSVRPSATVLSQEGVWNPDDFAREQIRGLVRQVFFSSRIPPVRQVVFSAAEPQTDVAGICEKVGWALALETSASIAIVGRENQTPTVQWSNDGK